MASTIIQPQFPIVLKPTHVGSRDGLTAIIDGQLLLIDDTKQWVQRIDDASTPKLGLPNIMRFVDVSTIPTEDNARSFTSEATQRLLDGLEQETPKDTTLPHVALIWSNRLCDVRKLVCNIVALLLARRYKLRAWEARDLAKLTLDKFIPGTWSTSITTDADFQYAYDTAFVTPPVILFYGHDPRCGPNHVFSQFYKTNYVGLDGVTYSCTEQEMHAQKAILFGDLETHARIMGTQNPYSHKKLGRQVRNFVQAVWGRECFAIVARANVAKFSSRADLTATLLATGTAEVYECVRSDAIWATGVNVADAERTPKLSWRGKNLLGKALVYARTQLQQKQHISRETV